MDKISSEEYLSQLIEQYQNLIFSICYKMTGDYHVAEDLTQETFLSAYRNQSSFTGGNEKAWICRIASNKSIDYMKEAARRVVPTEDISLEEKQSDSLTPEAVVMEQQDREQLLTYCRQLKKPYDEIAELYFYEDRTADEIALCRNRNKKTVQTQIYRAKAMLRKLYGRESG